MANKKKEVKKTPKESDVKTILVGKTKITGKVRGNVLRTPEGVTFEYSPDREA